MGKVGTEATLLRVLDAISDGNVYLKYLAEDRMFDVKDLRQMKLISDAGLAKDYFSIGDQITIDYTATNGTKYDMPWDIVHIGDATLSDGTTKHNAIYLQSHFATVEGVQYDHQENEKATEETAQEGMYYYIPNPNGDGNFQMLNINTGDTIDYTANPTVYHSAIKDTTGNIVRYGYNRETHAAMPQWLNSTAAKGKWWAAKHKGDVAPEQLNSVRGFMAGLPADFVGYMETLKITRALNTISEPDKNIASDSYDAKIFLPSIEQMYIEPQAAAGLEGEAWDYYKQLAVGAGLSGPFQRLQTYPILISYALDSQSKASFVRLSSACRDSSHLAWSVTSSGVVSNGARAINIFKCRPACVI